MEMIHWVEYWPGIPGWEVSRGEAPKGQCGRGEETRRERADSLPVLDFNAPGHTFQEKGTKKTGCTKVSQPQAASDIGITDGVGWRTWGSYCWP